MLKNFVLVLLGLLVGVSVVSYTFTARFLKRNEMLRSQTASVTNSEIIEKIDDPVEIAAPTEVFPAANFQARTEKLQDEKPLKLPTDEPVEVGGGENSILEDASTDISLSGSGASPGSLLSKDEKRRIEEAKADTGWANARFLPKEAQDVINPPLSDRESSDQSTE